MPRPKVVNLGSCSRDGCDKPCKTGGLCSMHYSRFSRYGSFERIRTRKKSYIHTQGYIVEHMPEHPLANSSNEVFQHRRVFYDAYGPGPFRCFGCDAELEWSFMHIDHIDERPSNNDISNLRAACGPCNVRRGKPKVDAYKRDRFSIEYRGEKYTLRELAEIKGMDREGLRARIKTLGIDEAMSRPLKLRLPRPRKPPLLLQEAPAAVCTSEEGK